MITTNDFKTALLQLADETDLPNGSVEFKEKRHALLSIASVLLLTSYRLSLYTDKFQQKANNWVRTMPLSSLSNDRYYVSQVKALLAKRTTKITCDQFINERDLFLNRILSMLEIAKQREKSRLEAIPRPHLINEEPHSKPYFPLFSFKTTVTTLSFAGLAAIVDYSLRPRV